MENDLSVSVDGWDFKQYVLSMLFYRDISENFIKFVNAGELEAENQEFDYAKLDNEDAEEVREDLVQSKGYFILSRQLFCNVKEKAPNNGGMFFMGLYLCVLSSVFGIVELRKNGGIYEREKKNYLYVDSLKRSCFFIALWWN